MPAPALDSVLAGVRSAVEAGRPEADVLAPGSAWNLSQTLQHCAQTVEYSVTGYPRLKPALYRRTVGALAKRAFLARGACASRSVPRSTARRPSTPASPSPRPCTASPRR